MATKKQTSSVTKKSTNSSVKRTSSRTSTKASAPIIESSVNSSVSSVSSKKRSRFILNFLLVVLLGATLFLLTKRFRGLVVAAVVNKTPITTFELNQALNKRYGKAVLDEIINERLLLEAAENNKITISKSDIDSEIQKLTDSLGGKENLQNAMTQYNINQQDLEHQVRLRLIQQRLTEKLFTVDVSDQEISDYYNSNKTTVYQGKALSEVKDQIVSELKDQKRQQKFSDWFQDLKSKAKVTYYLTN